MAHDAWFDTDENRALTAICTRKLISNIGVGGIIWGAINMLMGVVAMQVELLNVGMVILGVMMLGTGVQAIRKPTLGVLLTETLVTVALLVWNVGIFVLNLVTVGGGNPGGMVFPLIIAITFGNYYRKLGHLRELIASVEPKRIKDAKQMCKALVKKKLKNEPAVVETTDRRCRAQLMDGGAFFIHRNMMRAFVALKADVQAAVVKPEAKSLKLHFNHPLGKLKYPFDKRSSEKLKNWFAADATPPPLGDPS